MVEIASNTTKSKDVDNDADMLTKEVQVCFKTTLPERYQVPDMEIAMSTAATGKQLTSVVFQLLKEEKGQDSELMAELKAKKLNFMVNDTFLNLSLQDLIDHLSLSTEAVIDIYYFFALEKPKP